MNKFALGIDIGGTHAAAGIVDIVEKRLIEESVIRSEIDPTGSADSIITKWTILIRDSISKGKIQNITGIGIAIPGPFDYVNGISEILNVGKYESLFGLNIKYALAYSLKDLIQPEQIRFMNDAHCFLAGETWHDNSMQNVICLTLGTGFGSAFSINDLIVAEAKGIPPGGFLFNQPFHDVRAEDFFNSNWFINRYFELSGTRLENVKMIAQLAEHDKIASRIFEEFAINLAEFLSKYLIDFNAQTLIIGGSISKSSRLFIGVLERELLKKNIKVNIKISFLGEEAALIGAARLFDNEFYSKLTFLKNNNALMSSENHENGTLQATSWRKTEQFLAPVFHSTASEGNYDIYPSFPIGSGKIKFGFEKIADELFKYKKIIIY
jgi:glucokinase